MCTRRFNRLTFLSFSGSPSVERETELQGSVNSFLPGFQEWEVGCLLCLFVAVQTVEALGSGENVGFEVGHTDK